MTISGGMLSKQAQGPGASDSTLRTVEVPGFSLPFTVPSTRPFYQPAHSFLQPDGRLHLKRKVKDSSVTKCHLVGAQRKKELGRAN